MSSVKLGVLQCKSIRNVLSDSARSVAYVASVVASVVVSVVVVTAVAFQSINQF